MVTRTDVAKEAGVSPATVSYVLNNSRHISQATKEKVYNAVKQLGYKPNLIARGLVTKKTMQLALVLNDIGNPFYGEITRAFENEAIKYGYFVSICSGAANLDNYLDNFASRRVDGAVVLAIPTHYQLDKILKLSESGISVLLSGNLDINYDKISLLEHDYIDGMWQAVKHLYDLGHKKIAYISCFDRHVHFDPRIKGYESATSKLCISDVCTLIEGSNPYPSTIETGRTLTKKLIDSDRQFTAIICTNDLMAIGAIQVIKERGKKIPQDVSVIGCDDIVVAPMIDPALTTISIDKDYFGRKAFQMLHKSMQTNEHEKYTISIKLKVRKSTAPPII